MTLTEVADYLRLPEQTLYSQRRRGVEPGSLGIRIGRHVMYDENDIRDYVERMKQQR